MHPEEVPGPLPPEVGHLLAHLAHDVPADQAIVEVGSYFGRSTCFLAAGALVGQGAQVWAIDPWDMPGNTDAKRHAFTDPRTRIRFHQHLEACGVADQVTPVQAFSREVAADWDGPPIGLLFIDAIHSYDEVRADYRAWRPHLAPGAKVAFDDANTSRFGVGRFVRSLGMPISWHADNRLAVVAP